MDEPENTLLADDSSDDLENVKTAVRDEEEVKLKETIHFIVSKKCEQECRSLWFSFLVFGATSSLFSFLAQPVVFSHLPDLDHSLP